MAIAAVVLGDQGPGPEDVAGLDVLVARIGIPAQPNRPLQQAEHAVAGFAGPEDDGTGLDIPHLTFVGKGAHGVEGMDGVGHSRKGRGPILAHQGEQPFKERPMAKGPALSG